MERVPAPLAPERALFASCALQHAPALPRAPCSASGSACAAPAAPCLPCIFCLPSLAAPRQLCAPLHAQPVCPSEPPCQGGPVWPSRHIEPFGLPALATPFRYVFVLWQQQVVGTSERAAGCGGATHVQPAAGGKAFGRQVTNLGDQAAFCSCRSRGTNQSIKKNSLKVFCSTGRGAQCVGGQKRGWCVLTDGQPINQSIKQWQCGAWAFNGVGDGRGCMARPSGCKERSAGARRSRGNMVWGRCTCAVQECGSHMGGRWSSCAGGGRGTVALPEWQRWRWRLRLRSCVAQHVAAAQLGSSSAAARQQLRSSARCSAAVHCLDDVYGEGDGGGGGQHLRLSAREELPPPALVGAGGNLHRGVCTAGGAMWLGLGRSSSACGRRGAGEQGGGGRSTVAR